MSFDTGDKVICQVNELYNAFGEGSQCLRMGMRLTIREPHNFFGVRMLSFEELNEDMKFLADAFKPLRSLH